MAALAPPPLHSAPSAASDLREDLLGAWAPDPAGWADIDGHAGAEEVFASYTVQAMLVPRPGGRRARVHVLHPAWHAALHRGLSEVRDEAAAGLAPGVFGYRRGADATHRYADDWRAFSALVEERAASYPYLALSDVRSFFASTSWALALACLEQMAGRAAPTLVGRVARAAAAAGVAYLPTGYSDARFLGNMVLARAERELAVPFARWVDDYRLFLHSEAEGEAALATLDAGLASVGLRRNVGKTEVASAQAAAARHHRTLASVYHPERDAADTVARKLHEVFERAATDPVRYRREIRFCLPRLGEQADPVAIPFALDVLSSYPWEAPRAVTYLSTFIEDGDGLAARLDGPLCAALERGDAWIIARLAPLAAAARLPSATVAALGASLDRFAGTPAWGLILRVLALHGDVGVVRGALERPADARAALAAARDLDIAAPLRLVRAEPVLAEALERAPAPPPPAETLL